MNSGPADPGGSARGLTAAWLIQGATACLCQLAQRTPGVCGLRLYVETDNVRAQRTYESCGMRDARYRVMEVDYSGARSRAGE